MTDQRTYADRAEYLKMAVKRRRLTLKRGAIEYLGGSCTFCSYAKIDGALEFHHLKAETKLFGLSQENLSRRTWEESRKELDKCVMLCANCHREVHAGVYAAPHSNVRMKTG